MIEHAGSEPSIFINYRREDSRVYADMLYTWLSDRYGEERVFKDVDTIEVGLDFGEAIDRVVDASDVASLSRNTPYAGRELPGKVVATFLRGRPTVLDGKLA